MGQNGQAKPISISEWYHEKAIKGAWLGTLYANPYNPKIKDDRFTEVSGMAIRRICALKHLESQKHTITTQDYVEIKAEVKKKQSTYVCQN